MSFIDMFFGRKKKPTHFTSPDSQIKAEFEEVESSPEEDAAVEQLTAIRQEVPSAGDADRDIMTPEQLQVWRRVRCTELVNAGASLEDVVRDLGVNSGIAKIMIRAVKRRQTNPKPSDKQVEERNSRLSGLHNKPMELLYPIPKEEPLPWETPEYAEALGEKKKKKHLRKLIIIPDAHACPKHSNSRFTIAGKFINQERPDHVICLGDLADMESLSFYDKNKKSFEGRRYKKDIQCVIDAQEKLFNEIQDRDNIEFSILNGNHEERINTYINENAAQEGNMSLEDLQYETYWNNVYPFKEITYIEGIAFSHYFPNGLMDRPMGGENVARAMVAKVHTSAIAGHRHDYRYHTEPGPKGKKIFGLVAGCFLDTDQYEHYVSKTIQKTWWKGLVVLQETPSGEWDVQQVSLDRLKAMYE